MRRGFTLAELLVAITVIGVIAAFTVPKVFSVQAEKGWNANAKQAANIIQSSYSEYQMENKPASGMTGWDLTPYMNYVKVDTTTPIDDWQTAGVYGCDASHPCLVFQNGGRMTFPLSSFGNTYSTNAVEFQFDPDGKVTNGGDTSLTAVGKAVSFTLYYDGTLTDSANQRPVTCSTWWGCGGPSSSNTVPPWFNWTK